MALAAVLGVGTGGTALAQTDVCSRTTAVRDAIVAAVPGVSACADVTAVHLAGTTTLQGLASSELTSLQAGDFGGLTALLRLNLFGNTLATLPAGIFDDLTALKYLSLSSNRLATLPAAIFDNLTVPEQLDLSSNSLTTLRADIFDDLTALTQLRLGSNELTTLPDDVFEDLTALTGLRLQQNTGAPFSPAANAGEDQSALTGAAVALSGMATGAWGDNVTWEWTQVDGADSNTAVDAAAAVTLTGETAATTTFTAPSSAATLYFLLVVNPLSRPATLPGARNASS